MQERDVKMVSGLKSRTHLEKLREVSLTSFEERRTCGDMIQVLEDSPPGQKPGSPLPKIRDLGMAARFTGEMWNLKRPEPNQDSRRNFWNIGLICQGVVPDFKFTLNISDGLRSRRADLELI